MRKYIQGNKQNWHFFLGNGSREFMGWPLDLSISSYGWITKIPTKDGTHGWADSDVQIGPFRFTWQISVGKHGISVHVGYEIRRNY